jgi:heme-degrading monooxygenase HmoA
VYARSVTFHGRPGTTDAGITFLKKEAAPLLDTLEGCQGLSILVDRETGKCIATSMWENEAAMRASDEPLRSIRDRARDIFGGSMQIDEWESAVVVHAAHGDCCRVSWLQGDVDAMTESFEVGVLNRLELAREFCSASLLVNRAAGLGCVTTAWATRAAMEASRSWANDMRSRTASDAGGEIVAVHEFDLAYARTSAHETSVGS